MTNTATQHIEALLVNDGREFAMIRKSDLSALLQIAKTDPHQGRLLDSLAVAKRRICTLERITDSYHRELVNANKDALKHGKERRRYMANNKALQARVDQQDYAFAGLTRMNEAQRSDMFRYIDQIISSAEREAILEARLLRVARFKRKFPAVGALMDVTP